MHVLQGLDRIRMLREEGEDTNKNASDISTSNCDLTKKQCHLCALFAPPLKGGTIISYDP